MDIYTYIYIYIHINIIIVLYGVSHLLPGVSRTATTRPRNSSACWTGGHTERPQPNAVFVYVTAETQAYQYIYIYIYIYITRIVYDTFNSFTLQLVSSVLCAISDSVFTFDTSKLNVLDTLTGAGV